jgi:hypothetical protein
MARLMADTTPHILGCGCRSAAVVVDADHVCTDPTRPVEVNLTEAASWLLILRADSTLVTPYRACLTMWAMLVGLDHDRDAALALAERIVALPDPLTAYTPTL